MHFFMEKTVNLCCFGAEDNYFQVSSLISSLNMTTTRVQKNRWDKKQYEIFLSCIKYLCTFIKMMKSYWNNLPLKHGKPFSLLYLLHYKSVERKKELNCK
jgi:hypothetical protein